MSFGNDLKPPGTVIEHLFGRTPYKKSADKKYTIDTSLYHTNRIKRGLN